MTTNKIIVDIDVWNCQIRAFRPQIQTKMPNDDLGKQFFWSSVGLERLNKRQFGMLKGRGYKKAEKIVNQFGAINISGIYGSVEIDETDFLPIENLGG